MQMVTFECMFYFAGKEQRNIQKNVRELGLWIPDSCLCLERAFRTLQGQQPSTCFDQEPWRDWEERRWHDTCWLVRQIKAFKKMTVRLEYVLSFPFISERVESSFTNLTLTSLLDHKNRKNTVWVHGFVALHFGPFMVMTIIISSNNSSNCREVKDSTKRQTQRKKEERGARLCCSLLGGKPSAIEN